MLWLVNIHTIHIIRISAMCDMDQENMLYWSTSNHHANLYIGEWQGWTRLSPPAAIHLTEARAMQTPASAYPGTLPTYAESTQLTLGLRPYGSTSYELATPCGAMNHHIQPNSSFN